VAAHLGHERQKVYYYKGERSDFIIDVTAEKRLKDVIFIQDYKR